MLPAPPLDLDLAQLVALAQRLGRVQALRGLLNGIRAGGDPIELVEAMFRFEEMMLAAEDERRG